MDFTADSIRLGSQCKFLIHTWQALHNLILALPGCKIDVPNAKDMRTDILDGNDGEAVYTWTHQEETFSLVLEKHDLDVLATVTTSSHLGWYDKTWDYQPCPM